MTQIEQMQARLQPLYAALAVHPLYRSIESIDDLYIFMQSHVFAVWDFMSLLKTLQRGLTNVAVPWVPSALPESRRLINEIVLGEESDLYEGRALSHFELYLQAMRDCGAEVEPVERFLRQLRSEPSTFTALQNAAAPPAAISFVQDTFAVIESGRLHSIAAAFTFGREDLIPDMFRGFVRNLNAELAGKLSTFLWYLERHIEVDGEEHGPMALRMVAELCGDDARKWSEAAEAAEFALQSRLRLWDGIAQAIATTQPALAAR